MFVLICPAMAFIMLGGTLLPIRFMASVHFPANLKLSGKLAIRAAPFAPILVAPLKGKSDPGTSDFVNVGEGLQ